jgi:hypothetical protein
MTTKYQYKRRSLVGDGLRGGAGVALCVWPFAVASFGAVWTSILGALALMFAVYGLRAGVRSLSSICVDDIGIWSEGPFSTAIRWDELASVKLDYYSTNRDGRGGWMQLKLSGGGKSLKVDSALEGFGDIVDRAARVAHANEIEMTPETKENLRSLDRVR